MKPIPPDSSAFALSRRNFDVFSQNDLPFWFSAFQSSSSTDATPYPKRIIIELANTCNLDCPMCRVGAYGFNPDRIMPLVKFQQLAKTLFDKVQEVRLNGLGESTVIPHFADYLDVLANYSVSVELITNGTGETSLYKRMVQNGATLLFSCDAITPTRFEALRRPAKWEHFSEKVEAIGKYAEHLERNDQLHLLFTLQSANIEELPCLVKKAEEWKIPNVVVNVIKQKNDEWLHRNIFRILKSFEISEEKAKEKNIRLFLPDKLGEHAVALDSVSSTSASGCDRPWQEVVIRYDLDVQVCNMFNPYTYGNLELHSFERAWRGAFAQTFRNHINTERCHPYCKGCHYIGDVYERKQS